MKKNYISMIAACLSIMLLVPEQAIATDGYFSLAYGTRSKGMGGAGIALYETSLFGANNPAGLVRYGKGYGIAAGLFNPNRSYTITGEPSIPNSFPPAFGLAPGKVTSESKLFVMPSIAANFMVGSKNALGVALYGNGGMNTNYPERTFYSQYLDGPAMPDGSNPMQGVSEPTGVNLMQLFAAIQYSRALGENWSIGLSAIGSWQSFEAKGLQAFVNFGMSQSPMNVTNNGADRALGIGGKIGIIGKLSEQFHVGATFQTPIWMQAFDRYKGLFAEGGKFDVPANWSAGIAYKPTGKLNLVLDVKQIFYSKVKSIGNRLNTMALMPMVPNGSGGYMGNPMYTPLGSDNGSGFGWKDMFVVKVVGEYMVSEKSTLRVGFSHGQSPVPSSEVLFNILAPGVVESHITAGYTRNIGTKALDFAVVYALNNKISGSNPLDPAQQVELQMNQFEFEIGFRF